MDREVEEFPSQKTKDGNESFFLSTRIEATRTVQGHKRGVKYFLILVAAERERKWKATNILINFKLWLREFQTTIIFPLFSCICSVSFPCFTSQEDFFLSPLQCVVSLSISSRRPLTDRTGQKQIEMGGWGVLFSVRGVLNDSRQQGRRWECGENGWGNWS